MKATGIVRRYDAEGRITVPKELRRNVYGTEHAEGKPVEFYYDKYSNTIGFMPYIGATKDEFEVGEIIETKLGRAVIVKVDAEYIIALSKSGGQVTVPKNEWSDVERTGQMTGMSAILGKL